MIAFIATLPDQPETNRAQLRTLCFDMEVPYDDLPGDRHSDKVMELIAYFERRSRLPELVAKCKELRPKESWD